MARVVVLGRSGTGKSYYTGYLLEKTVPEFDLAIHYDIEDEEIGLSYRRLDPLYQTLRVDTKLVRKLDWRKVIASYKKIRVVPIGLTEKEIRALYAGICRVVMEICRGWKGSAFISCDEAHNILKQSSFPTACERMITGGRKHGVECLHISQRPQLLHTTVISQADKRVYFGISDDNDLRKIDQQSSFPASRLKELQKRTCIVENKNTGEWVEIDTEGIGRRRPHFSGDDGIVDRHLPV